MYDVIYECPLMNFCCPQFEYEELMALKCELERRKRSERNEMEDLREEIATMQTLYQYRLIFTKNNLMASFTKSATFFSCLIILFHYPYMVEALLFITVSSLFWPIYTSIAFTPPCC